MGDQRRQGLNLQSILESVCKLIPCCSNLGGQDGGGGGGDWGGSGPANDPKGYKYEPAGGGPSDPHHKPMDIESASEEVKKALLESKELFEVNAINGNVDAESLKKILDNFFADDLTRGGFTLDSCRSMVAMRDFDNSGKLNYTEFLALWQTLMQCKKTFREWDTQKQGYFDSSQYQAVLESLGYDVNTKTLKAITVKYSDKKGHVGFEDFLTSAVKLLIMTETFRNKDPNCRRADFVTDEFIQLSLNS